MVSLQFYLKKEFCGLLQQIIVYFLLLVVKKIA